MKLKWGHWFTFVPLGLLAGYLIVDAIQSAPEPAQSAPNESDAAGAIQVWRAQVQSPQGGLLEIFLTPLHGEIEHERYDAEKLRARFDLVAGEPFRLELKWPAGELLDPGYVPSVIDAQGRALERLARAQNAAVGTRAKGQLVEPLATVFGLAGSKTRSPQVYLLWGRVPVEAAELVLSLESAESGKNPVVIASYPMDSESLPCDQLPRSPVRLEVSLQKNTSPHDD